ncbi:MAG: RING finger protein [Candidatus Hodarchaeales archaeon]|jgi:hypothetical protein
MEIDLEDKDKIILFLIYPAVLGSLSLLLGIIYTESGYLKLNPETGEIALPSMVIPLVFGYLNLVLVPELLNLYEKGSPFSINLVLAGSFSLTFFTTNILAIVMFLVSGNPISDEGLNQSHELNLITPFSSYGLWGAWLIGGFVYIWWRASEYYTPTDTTHETRTSNISLTTCSICKSKIKPESETINCPDCNTSFHFGHFAEWVRQKGTCPICKERVHL